MKHFFGINPLTFRRLQKEAEAFNAFSTNFLHEHPRNYRRFILQNLQNPITLVNRWLGELPPGGKLLIEELEAIETDVDVFRKYLCVHRGLLASRGSYLYPGEVLAGGLYEKANVLVNASFRFPIKNCDAATMFFLNTVNVWEREEYVRNTLSGEQRREITSQLLDVMDSYDRRTGIVWKMRRMVLQREADPSPAVGICTL